MRLVIDTNVVLDLVAFDEPSTRPLADAIKTGAATVHACAETLAELRRVLARPKFGPGFDAEAAYARYVAWAQLTTLPAVPAAVLPRCRDADDQVFLALALAARAERLVTRDRALLALAARTRRGFGFDICTPARLLAAIGDNGGPHGA